MDGLGWVSPYLCGSETWLQDDKSGALLMSPMSESFSLSWDTPDEIDSIKKFLKFHAKRLKCTEYEVLLKMAKELEKGILVEAVRVPTTQILPKKKKEEPVGS